MEKLRLQIRNLINGETTVKSEKLQTITPQLQQIKNLNYISIFQIISLN